MPKEGVSKSKKTTKSKNVNTNGLSAKASPALQQKPRKLKQTSYRSFRLSKRIKHEGKPLPSAWRITKQSLKLLWRNKVLFGGVLLIYAVLQLVLVQGILGANFGETSQLVKEALGNQWSGLASSLTLFSYLLTSAGQTNTAEAGVYQSFLLLIATLAIIWSLRQVLAGHTVRIRDAYYKGMYPLVPFLLVLIVVLLQTIPLLIGAWLYQTVLANGIAASVVEYMFWILIFAIFATLTVYMICSSLFALYVATLPDMTPIKALRSARNLVLHRRWSVLRKLLFLLLSCMLFLAIVLVPTIIVYAPAAPVVFYALTVLALGYVHTYLYSLYRELLTDA